MSAVAGDAGEVTAVVPTLGTSPWLADCVAALRREGGGALELVVVEQPPGGLPQAVRDLVDRVVALPRRAGFAAAANAGAAASRRPLLALVNDDAVPEPGWLPPLLAHLAATPRAAAVQGASLDADRPQLAEGCGLAWNRWWQAVQLGRGGPAPDPTAAPREVFGVSATAALYRRSALAAVGAADAPFDAALDTYYEDVELAVRLRGGGWGAAVVPASRVRHAGGGSAEALGAARLPLLYGNRHLVLARLLGRAFWPRWPWIALRDVGDGLRHPRLLGSILAGWSRALRLLPRYARRGPPRPALAELRRFRSPR
ncbi:MAG TPA: glycosyltransferase [Thermoanaerobaculia bacterium]|nr:glycosyltransferase [Thermoanaerobaculia bacterium]